MAVDRQAGRVVSHKPNNSKGEKNMRKNGGERDLLDILGRVFWMTNELEQRYGDAETLITCAPNGYQVRFQVKPAFEINIDPAADSIESIFQMLDHLRELSEHYEG